MYINCFNKHKGRYGYRRITLEIRKSHPSHPCVNHKTIKKFMGDMGLKSCVRKVRYRSYKGTTGKVAPNILERNFTTDKPLEKVATDVTQINIGSEKCYLSPIMNLYNGQILSYTISDSPNLKMVMDMLTQLHTREVIPHGMIVHSDQGWHYQHIAYQNSLQEHGIVQSMSRKGNCLDNAMMENFFGIMKSELLYVNKYETMQAFKDDLVELYRVLQQ